MSPSHRIRHVRVAGVRTQYLEAGEGPVVVLLHGGEHGACAELTWRATIGALARSFRVVAPDMVGFGGTEKLHHFEGPSELRIRHIAAFCETLCIDRAHFMGASYGGSLLLRVARQRPVAWPIDRMVVVSGGGKIPVNEHREVLLSYDGSIEHMRRILRVLFYDPAWSSDERVREWHESSLRPGAWEALSASRLVRPGASGRWSGEVSGGPWEQPTLIVAGADDLLREPGYADDVAAEGVAARAEVFERARHYPHIEHPDRFNELALRFLEAGGDVHATVPAAAPAMARTP
jgi:pimeloyl-ACP methyl ester carboxylesterase